MLKSFTKRFSREFVWLLFVLTLFLGVFQSVAVAKPYIQIDVNNIYFLNGNRIQMEVVFSNSGDRHATVTGVNWSKVDIRYPNGNLIWNGSVNYTGMNVYVPVGGWVKHTFYITNVNVPYYEGYRRWNCDYNVYWTAH